MLFGFIVLIQLRKIGCIVVKSVNKRLAVALHLVTLANTRKEKSVTTKNGLSLNIASTFDNTKIHLKQHEHTVQ